MPTREELGAALHGCLSEVHSLLDGALKAAMEQRDALLNNDVEALVRTCRVQEEMLRRIAECDQRAADAATELAGFAGLDTDSIDTTSIGRAAGEQHEALIQSDLQGISETAERLREANEINKHLLSNGLDIVANCLRLLAKDNGPSSYSSGAEITETKPCILSLDTKA